MAGYGREDGGDNEQVGKVCPPVAKHGHAQTKGFAAATAEVTGESKRAINLNVARAEAIGDDLLRLTGTSLDKGVELDALARLPEPERKELIERAVAGGFVTVTKTSRACFRLRSTTKVSNCPMRQAEKRDFVPRFVPRFCLRYPSVRPQSAGVAQQPRTKKPA